METYGVFFCVIILNGLNRMEFEGPIIRYLILTAIQARN